LLVPLRDPEEQFTRAINTWSSEAPEIRRQTPLMIVLLLFGVTFWGIEGLEVTAAITIAWYWLLQGYKRQLIDKFKRVMDEETELLCNIEFVEEPHEYAPSVMVFEPASGMKLGKFKLLVSSDHADQLAGAYDRQYERYTKHAAIGNKCYLIVFDRSGVLCGIRQK
jgi:hypothetical protein